LTIPHKEAISLAIAQPANYPKMPLVYLFLQGILLLLLVANSVDKSVIDAVAL